MAKEAKRRDPEVVYLARYLPKGLETGLRNYWYPVLKSEDLPVEKPVGFKVLNEELVAWRDRAGRPKVLRDRCPHRGAKLSPGRVLGGDLQCAWHGLRFDGAGRCTLIPWEPPESRLGERVKMKGYPAEELGGWIWAYIGEPEQFPPPPLAEVVPEELLHPERFVVFSHPIMRSAHNWLQAIDGNDAFHAVMLHSDSQAVASEAWEGGAVKRPPAPLAERRVKLVDTPQGLRGIASDAEGRQIHHGHFMDGWKGERWTLPGLFSVPIRPAPNVQPYVARVYQFAVDARHTQSCRWVALRAATDGERERANRLWHEVIRPRQLKVIQEDLDILDTIGDVVEARAAEILLNADRDVVTTRRMFSEAFLAQLRGTRPMPTKDALVCPF